MKDKINTFLKVYPWYYSLSCWLLFYDILNTLYLTSVKGLSALEFSLLSAIALFFSIVLQMPLLKVIKKIGNTISLRLGNFIFILGAILLTFCNSFIGLTMGQILYELSFIFKTLILVELRKNLIYINHEEDFIKHANNATVKYYIVALITSLLAGPLFNINNYLPMYLSIISACLCLYFSFYLFDVTELDTKLKKVAKSQKESKTIKIWSIIFILLIITFSIETGVIDFGPSEAKLFVQTELQSQVNIGKAAFIISFIVALSYIFAIISNKTFSKIYKNLKDKSGYLLSTLLILSFTLLLTGYFLPVTFVLKIMIMILGYLLIEMVKGPFTVYLEDLILKNGKPGLEQDLSAYINLARNIGGAAISGLAAIILVFHSLNYVIWMLLLVCVLELYLFSKVNKLIQK